MKNKLILTILILGVCLSLFSAENKSAKKAILLSAIVPGAGQLYSQNYTKMGIFFASEATIWYSKNRFIKEENLAENSFKTYANKIAGVPKNTSPEKYNTISNYISSDEYNKQVYLVARNYFLINNYDPEAYQQYIMENTYNGDESWDWKSTENRMQFRELRRKKQRYNIYNNFTLGAFVINRIISVVDAGKSVKAYNKHQVYATPTNNGKGICLNYEYKF